MLNYPEQVQVKKYKIINNVDPFETMPKGDTLCCHLYKLGSEQTLTDQTTYINWAGNRH